MATRGGKREGAGRKPGTVNKKARAMAERVLESGGLTPLEVMIKAMVAADALGDTRDAAYYAQMAAPYMHAKLSSVTADTKITGGLTLLTEFPE